MLNENAHTHAGNTTEQGSSSEHMQAKHMLGRNIALTKAELAEVSALGIGAKF